jgi:hypothetical protein
MRKGIMVEEIFQQIASGSSCFLEQEDNVMYTPTTSFFT